MYRFIALLDHANASTVGQTDATDAALALHGLHHVCTIGALRLYASAATPLIHVDHAGVVIGHLFSREFRPVEGQDPLPGNLSQESFRRLLLDHFWGEYLLLQPAVPHTQAFTVLRDPSGGVPCLYAYADGVSLITSDISLAQRLKLLRARIDWDGVAHQLAYPRVKASRTGLSGVRELLPGCTLTLGPWEARVEGSWSPWAFVDIDQRYSDFGEATSAIRSTVGSVVKSWAEADGALLLELSGGLDSSIVAASLRGTRARVSCCTLVTPVPGADERLYARLMADGLGVDLREKELSFDNAHFSFEVQHSTARPALGGLQYLASEVMTALARAHGAASSFSGGGGDTVFCYLTNASPAADALRERGIGAATQAVHDLATLHDCTVWHAGRLMLRKLARARNAALRPTRSLLMPSCIADTPEMHPWFEAPPNAYAGDLERIVDLSGTQMFRDGAPRGQDRFMRMPLLSQPVVEACLRVPTWMWISGGHNRAVARAAFADALPPLVLNRRSKGTFMNFSGALYQRNKKGMRDFLLSGRLREQRIIDEAALERLIDSDLPPRDRSFMRVLELCTTENWLRQQG